MKKHSQFIVGLTLALVLLLSACGTNLPAATRTPDLVVSDTPSVASVVPVAITNTPDPCAPENIEAEVMKVHKYMREFDDLSALALSLTREELTRALPELQRVRREAEDQVIPYCLGDLKTYQVTHMNIVINTLLAAMSGSEQDVLNQGVALAGQQKDKYLIEIARLLGLTVESITAVPLPTETPPPPTP